MKKSVFICASAALLAMTSCSGKKHAFDGSGVFEADEITVSSEMGGRLVSLDAKEGQQLAEGVPVGVVDTVQLHLRRLQLTAQAKAVLSRRPDMAAQEAALSEQIAAARTERVRIENLVRADAAGKKQLDDVTTQIAVLEKQLAALRSTLAGTVSGVNSESSALDIQVAQIADQIRRCRIVNPVNGTVLSTFAFASEMTAPGRALYRIAALDTMTLRAYVTGAQMSTLRLGQKVTVSADYGTKDRRTYEGVISWISAKAEFTPKTVQTRDERANLVYAVKVRVKNDGYLKIGMYGDFSTGTK